MIRMNTLCPDHNLAINVYVELPLLYIYVIICVYIFYRYSPSASHEYGGIDVKFGATEKGGDDNMVIRKLVVSATYT